MMTSVAHIGITVSNLDASVRFYRDVLELHYVGEMFMEGPETETLFRKKECRARVAYLAARDPNAPLVELIQFVGDVTTKGHPDLFTTSISELCFAAEDIEKEYQRLEGLGVVCHSAPQMFDSTKYGFGKSKAIYFEDPDGNILELIQPVK